jgi:hypothetical protein
MNSQDQIRPRGPRHAVAAVFTLLAILIAPVCAPLCAAAKHCSQGTRLERCHEMATTGDRNAEKFVAPAKDCGQADFSAVLVRADEQSSHSREVRNDLTPRPPRLSPECAVGSVQANPTRWGVHQVPFESPDFHSLNAILRI